MIKFSTSLKKEKNMSPKALPESLSEIQGVLNKHCIRESYLI